IVDHEIRELDVRDFVFIAIRRAGGDLIIPSGAVRIRPDDVITVFTKKEAEAETIRTLNRQLKRSG
ncbi:MAG: TrkA C-terminal domain-containing protein, partial [Methanoculleus sp.]